MRTEGCSIGTDCSPRRQHTLDLSGAGLELCIAGSIEPVAAKLGILATA